MSFPHIFSDFDGTITSKDTLVFLATRLGGGPQMVEAIGRLIREGKLTLAEGIAAEMRSVRATRQQADELLRGEVALDPFFKPFAQWCETREIPLTILSAGFHQNIELFITRDEYPRVEVLANNVRPNEEIGWQCEFRDTSDYGHDKARAIKAARGRGEYTIFIGDGLSDRAAADAADEVFAKHSLIGYCRDKGIGFREFETFEEIHRELQTRY
jgi:2,3-diketo-5-methylthio-1-phosphopentane phosphatase